jgi:predicted PurR-regulated permease PerM
LGLLFSSCLLAFLLDSPAIYLERRGISRLQALLLVFAIFTAVVATVGWLLYPALITELQDLGVLINDAQASDGAEKADPVGPAIKVFGRNLTAGLVELLRSSRSASLNISSSLFYWPMLVVFGFFFLKDGHRIKKSALNWIANRHLEMTIIVVHRIRVGAKRYLVRQLPVVFLVGILSATALHLLGVRFSLLLGATAGFAQMIPYFGAGLGAIPAVLWVLADGGSISAVLALAVAFAAIEMIKNLALSVFRVPGTVKLSPLSTVIALLVGTQIMGIPGMLLAVPLASLSKISLCELRKGLNSYGGL